jgi:hypothetical protein
LPEGNLTITTATLTTNNETSHMNRKSVLMTALASGALALAQNAGATPLTVTATRVNSETGQSLAASVKFEVSSGNLVVTLRNTATSDVLAPSDVLTGVFFNLGSTLTPISAKLATGSTVWFGPLNGGNVGGEWAYKNGLAGAPGGVNSGISSTGLGLFGNANFNGSNLQGPTALDGLQYGITSAGDNKTVGNSAVTGGFALIKSGVVFKLSGVTSSFNPATAITKVSFQYGTSLAENPTPSRVPDGGMTALLLGIGLSGLGLVARRRNQ